jgi:hypothetical protein
MIRSVTLLLFLALCACAPDPVTIRFAGVPDDALVTIDDRYVDQLGRIAKRGIRLSPGTYRVTVEQVGYFPKDILLEVPEEGLAEPVKIELTPIPD